MQQLIGLLPAIHIAFVVLLLAVYFFRGVLLILDSPKAAARGMISLSSFMTLIVFFSGIALAFIMRLSFSDGFMLTKVMGLLIFVALGVAAFFPKIDKSRAVTLWGSSMLIFVYLVLVATKKLPPLL